jgi:hypothetical protein
MIALLTDGKVVQTGHAARGWLAGPRFRPSSGVPGPRACRQAGLDGSP